jgi:hypothetical protein
MDDKKVVNTQHVKYIETLSRIRNISLLNQMNSSVDGAVEISGLAYPIRRIATRCVERQSPQHLLRLL